MSKHAPTPWKVVTEHHFANGYFYTSIQPVEVDVDAMQHLRMAGGDYHVCRMSHTAVPHKSELHRANADFIVAAVNSHAEMLSALRFVETRCVSEAAYKYASLEDRKMRDLVVAAIAAAEGRAP